MITTGDNKNPTSSLKDLRSIIQTVGLPFGWTLLTSSDEMLKFVHIKQRKKNPMKDPLITKSIIVHEDRTWTLRVHDKIIQHFDGEELEILTKYTEIKSSGEFFEILYTVDTAKICLGNPDFEEVPKSDDTINSNRETNFEVESNEKIFESTIRSTKCHLLIGGRYDRCAECSKHRSYLRVLKSRQSKQSDSKKHYTESNSHVNYRYLSSTEKTERLKTLHKELTATRRLLNNTRRKLESVIAKEGHVLDSEMNDYLSEILTNNDHIKNELPEGSFRRLFWQQQLQALSCKDSRQIRWHPIMVKWCLNVKLRSTSAYKAMRDSGFIKLPSERTLRDYTHWTKVSSGFQPSSFERLLVDIRYHQLADWQKYVVLLHDEIKIKSDLVYCKHTGQLIGFANLGEVNNALVDFEKQLEDEYTNGKPDIASYMLVFMVRGITTRLEYPLAHFPCSGCITADFIFPLLWEAVKHLETIGLKVIASTSDGASSNRKFIKMHKPPKSAKEIELYKTKNIYSPEERDLFFISDVPHLMKTVRNNWENSGWNKKTRELWVKTCILTIYIVYR